MEVERRIERAADGSFVIRIDAEERELLRTLPGQLRALLEETPDDPSLRRLFPPAYAPDSMENLTFESEYRRFMGQDLHDRRVTALAVLEETVDAQQVSEEQLTAWMTALNDVRLVLGTRLDVSEELDAADLPPDDPRIPGLALYGYLSWLLEQIVESLAGEA